MFNCTSKYLCAHWLRNQGLVLLWPLERILPAGSLCLSAIHLEEEEIAGTSVS